MILNLSIYYSAMATCGGAKKAQLKYSHEEWKRKEKR